MLNQGVVKITETECYDCDYAENCEWGVILANSTCISGPCVAKQWHDKSMKTFHDMTQVVRKKIEGGGEEVQRGKWDNWRSVEPEFIQSHSGPVTVGEFCERSKQDKDLM